MSRPPHTLVAAPWDGREIALSPVQWRHLTRVLRLKRGSPLTYTDGFGRFGEGELSNHSILRGEEREIPRQNELVVAVAPPRNKHRQRFLVEKMTELGITRLEWLETVRGEGRVAAGPKLFSWVVAGLEQSRGSWLMDTRSEFVTWKNLEEPVVVCQPEGGPLVQQPRTVVIGPEGGFADQEVPDGLPNWGLGPNTLRIETAALVATARILN